MKQPPPKLRQKIYDYPENGGNKFNPNIGNKLPTNTAQIQEE
jgi:hypothetical protein